ncbi:MAG: DUF3108 domain-containing protein [Xanthomonadales bacterium]|nr:DUF3108 domain-containing protein [Xanthomonadales bacterium]
MTSNSKPRVRLRSVSFRRIVSRLRAPTCLMAHARRGRALLRATAALSCLVVMPSLSLGQVPSDFTAQLEVFRNGKLLGESTVEFSSHDGEWTMSRETRGTRGLARFIGLHESSRTTGDWAGGAPRPLHFERTLRVFRKTHWLAEFDWQAGVVHSVYPDGESTLKLEPGIIDESSIDLVVRSGLQQGESEWFLQVVDEEEIEHQHFKTLTTQALQTHLGCMITKKVEKIRDETSKRYTRTFYAADHDYVPVFMVHGKKDGEHLETRLVSLSVAGVNVEPGADCPENPPPSSPADQ